MLDIDMPSYLSKHDVVYLSPPRHGWEGLPLGNGSFGGPVWATDDGMLFQANHTDAYELPDPDGGEQQAGWYVLRSCGRLRIQHAVPMHDWLYLNDFKARLAMHPAEAEFDVRGGFGRFRTSCYIHSKRPVAVFRHQAEYLHDMAEAGAPIRISLERWGSRVFGWWYGGQQGGASCALGGVSAKIEHGDIRLDCAFRGLTVALRARVIGSGTTASQVHSHQAELQVHAAPKQDFTILLACVTSREAKDPVAAARAALDGAVEADDLQREHRKWWGEFWNRSFVHVGDDYIENLYYLHHYLMGSSCRGQFPPPFNGGLWIWNRDVRNWVNPHHWNQQQSFWCLPAANRIDLLRPYLDTYRRLMPEAVAATRRRGFSGMLWIDQHDYLGRQVAENAPSFKDNHTPASQIAMFFWWHYRFTGDLDSLRARGYPFMVAAAEFYLGFLRWIDSRQCYEVPLASTYEDETTARYTDSITNLAMIRALFPAVLQASRLLGVDGERQGRWQHVLDHLPPFGLNARDKARGVTLASGFLDGREVPEQESHNHGPLFAPVMPAGVIGLKDRDTPLFDAARNTLATYPGNGNVITPVVCIAARLGMPDECLRRLETMVRDLQQFPGGAFFNIAHWHYLSRRAPKIAFGHFEGGPGNERRDSADVTAPYQRDYLQDRGCRFRNVAVNGSPADGVAPHQADTPCDPFSQMGMESLGHFTHGLQEMLLQSHEGPIRVFPATPDRWEGAFTLLAEGGFLVSSHRAAGQPASFIKIVSRRGGRCLVELPWPRAVVSEDGTPVGTKVEAQVAALDTLPEKSYLLTPSGVIPQPPRYSAQPNAAPKHFREATIGIERDY